jgi:hypothetical protein
MARPSSFHSGGHDQYTGEEGMRSPANEADYSQDTARPTEADKHPLEDAA